MSCSWLATSITACGTLKAPMTSSNWGPPAVQPDRVRVMGRPLYLATCSAVCSSDGGPVSRPASASSTTAARCATTSATSQPGQVGTGVASAASSSPATSAVSRSRVSRYSHGRSAA